MVLAYLLLAVICILGVTTTASDLRHGKIYNKTIAAAMAAAVVVNAVQLQFGSLLLFSANLFFAFLAGFILFAARMWSAADAKLFLAYALLVPGSFNVFGSFPLFPSLNILVNAFVPAFLFLLVRLLQQTTAGQKIESLGRAFALRNLAYLSAGVFALGWLVEVLLFFLGIPGNFFLNIFILFILIELVGSLVPGKFTAYLIALLALGRIALQFSQLASAAFLLNFALSVLSILLLFYFTVSLGFLAYGKRTRVSELKQGMVLLEAVAGNSKGKFVKKDIFSRGLFAALGSMKTPLAIDVKASGLQQRDIERLRQWQQHGKLGFDSILVQRSFAFAPILFFGVILTILCSGNCIAFLASLLLKGL